MDHILIVEDEATLRTSLVRCLQGQPELEATGAATLQEAVAALNRQSPNLLVLDVDLPDGSGLELVPELALRGLNVPVILITAHLQRFQAEFPDSANVDVLQKPFEIAEFRRLVLERLVRAKTGHLSSAFTVADYLQLAGMARRSIVLMVNEGARTLGHIIVQDGAPRWAEDQLGGGEAAFRRLSMLQCADVSCRPLDQPIAKVNLSGSLEKLLIDAARHADEGRRRANSAKPRARSSSPESSRPTVSPPAEPTMRAKANPSPTGAESGTRAAAEPPPLPTRPRGVPPPKPQAPAAIGLAAFPGKPAGDSKVAQERVVTLTKTPKINLSQILALDTTIKAVARADRQGSVLEASGEMDAETTCAVVTLAIRQIGDATAELGLGPPSAWHVSVGASTWYVVQSKDEVLVTRGNVTKNPISTLKKVVKACGAVQ